MSDNPTKPKRLTVGSLFAGIGGLDEGFELAGFEIIWQVERDEFCRRVLEKRFTGAQRFGDVRDCGAHNLAQVDIVIGGDPCQENSNACQASESVNPSLGGEFIRIVDALRPRIVLRENPSVVRSDAPWPWWRFRSELERLGYAVLPFELRACCIGADHKRERLYLLAEIQDTYSAGLEGHEREVLEGADGRERHGADITRSDRWSATPRICRATDGIRNRTHRLRALGNAVVPQIAQWIAERIKESLTREVTTEHG